jgi:hypothetical protein
MSRGQFFVSRNTGYWRFRHPPRDGTRSHDFQTLQFDFGLLLDPTLEQDVARSRLSRSRGTAPGVSAVTRLVPLVPLLRQRGWPGRADLLTGFLAYGRTDGAWDDTRGYLAARPSADR